MSLEDIGTRFVWNRSRKALFDGLTEAMRNLARAGVRRVWINGSFVTDKDEPNDIDGCWEQHSGVDANRLDPVFLDTDSPRESMRKKYGVDFLIAGTALTDAAEETVESFFQEDRNGNSKGILLVEIGAEP